MAQALSKASAHVSSGDVAERHDRREYTPKNADRSLGGRNVIIHDVGDYREAINAEFREDVLAYNASQRRVERHKSLDYYSEVASSTQQEPVYEFVIGVGSRETCGVCDDPFDDEEFEAAQAADRADGGHRADDYEAAHFDGRRWEQLKAEGREDEASEYVQRHLAKGLKAEAHDKAVAILKDVARALIENRPDPRTGRRPIPKGFKLMMVVLHDDEPCGTPHLHVAVCPIAEGYSRGMRRRIGLAKALEQGGYKGKGAMPELYEHVRQDVMVPIMKAHDVGRDLERVHRAKREADRMRARAEVALHGYEPPAGVELVPPAAMPPELRALWRLTDGDEGDDAVYDLPDDLLGEDGEPDLDAANERVVDLADEFARERGYAQAYVDGDGAWLVTPPLEFMRQQDGYEDVESVDELTDDDRLYWSEKWWDEASLRIADAQLLGLDPTVAHPGIDEREAAVEASRADVERRDRVVGEREEALRGLTDRAEERITGFLGRVVGDVGYIACRTLGVMVEMGVGGERFASAARVCMDVINAMSEDAIGRPFSQTLAGRVQERVARSFARAFARDARRDAAVREVGDTPQAGRSRDDGPGL